MEAINIWLISVCWSQNDIFCLLDGFESLSPFSGPHNTYIAMSTFNVDKDWSIDYYL